MRIPGFFSYISFGLLYKLTGFVKLILQMRYLSDSDSSDIYLQCNKILIVFRRPVVSGTFQSLFSLYYEKNRSIGKEKQFSAFCLIYLSAFFILLSFLVAVLLYPLSTILNIRNLSLFYKNMVFFLPIIPGMFLLYFFKSMADLQGKFFFSSSSTTIGNLFAILCVISFARFNLHFSGFLVSALVYCFFQVIYLFLPIRSSFVFDKSFHDWNFIKDFLKIQYESLIPVSELITGSIASKLGKGIISHIDYSHKCLQFIFSLISDSLISVTVPILSANKKSLENMKNVFMTSHILASLLALFLGFHGSKIALFILQKTTISNFESFTKIMSIMSLSTYFYIMNRTISSILISQGRLGKSLISQILNGMLNIIFSFLLLGYKQYGIVWASNISSFVQLLISSYNLFNAKGDFLNLRDKINFVIAPISAFILVKNYYYLVFCIFFYLFNKTFQDKNNNENKNIFFLIIFLVSISTTLVNYFYPSRFLFFILYSTIYISSFYSYLKILV